MSEQDRFEDDLLYSLTRTGEGFRTESAPLVAGGLARGRRSWRRRSATAVVGGAAALGLVGTGVFQLVGSGGPAPVATVAATVAAAASGTPAPSAPATAPAVTAKEVLGTFTALLPKGEVSETRARGDEDVKTRGSYFLADLVFDDGGGKSLLSLSITKRSGKQEALDCPADFRINRIDGCTATTLPDGSRLVVTQGHEYTDGRADTKQWFARLSGPDGREIMLSEWNSEKEKGAPDSRVDPPLTPAQLTAVVTDRSWDRIVSALQPEQRTAAPVEAAYTPAALASTFTGLLPAGVQATAGQGEAGAARLTVSAGGRSGALQLRAEDWTKQPAGTFGKLFGGAGVTLLPDGTKVMASGGTVHALHPDGLYVAIATDGKAPLTVEQLKEIAGSPVWKQTR